MEMQCEVIFKEKTLSLELHSPVVPDLFFFFLCCSFFFCTLQPTFTSTIESMHIPFFTRVGKDTRMFPVCIRFAKGYYVLGWHMERIMKGRKLYQIHQTKMQRKKKH